MHKSVLCLRDVLFNDENAMKGAPMKSKRKLKTHAQAFGHATAATLLNDLLQQNVPLVEICATAALMVEYTTGSHKGG